MDWTANQQCVLCDEGGNLLVCSVDGCPISVHQSCMGCEAHLDDAGNFHCPYCLYKQITTEARQLKEKVILTKEALSIFLEEATDGKEDEVSSKDKSADDINSVGNYVQDYCEETDGTLVPEESNVNTCRVMVVYMKDTMKADQLESDFSKRIKVDNRRGNDKCKIKVVDQQQYSTSLTLPSRDGKDKVFWTEEEEDVLKDNCEETSGTLVPEEHNVDTCPVMVGYIKDKMKADQLESDAKWIKVDKRRVNAKCKLEFGNQQLHSTSLTQQSRNGRHKVFWTEEEEDMLKEGVQKFSSETRKNLPWKKILDFGRHVFNPNRTPSDLKDKWRKIAK